MIKLKSLIVESELKQLDLSKSQSGIAFTTSKDMKSFNDPYEYKYTDGLWYTRKRDTNGKWIDMKQALSVEDWTNAVDIILNKVYRVKTSDLKKNQDAEIKKPTNQNIDQDTPIKQDSDIEHKKIVKQDLGIKRDNLGYITSGKSSVYNKTFTLRTNLNNAGVIVVNQLDVDDIDRKTGQIDHGLTDVVTTLWPEETKYYQISGIKTITMPTERGAYSKDKDPQSGNKFTYLYIVGSNGYKGWIPSNVVKINS